MFLFQVINLTIEHLVLLMQIMDSNATHIDELFNKQFEWTFLNGYLNATIIQNIINNYKLYCEEIKVKKALNEKIICHVISIYQPRYSKACAVLKQVQPATNKQSIERLVYQPINCPCSPHKQYTFDLALAKIGGIKQMLMLIADVNIII